MKTRVAFVTGAARGIGQAIAVELAGAGCDIALCDLQPEAGALHTVRAVEAYGRRALYHQADVGDRKAMELWFAEALADLGRIDVLVNNAAMSIRKPLLDLEPGDVERVWSTSLWGVFHCSQLAARHMAEQQDGGSIIVIGSVLASRPHPGSTAYNGAKAAVKQMARTWAVELASHRIRVNVVEPGWTDTPGERVFSTEQQLQDESKRLPLGRLATANEIAKAVCFLASDDASYITGACLEVDGGFSLVR